MSRLFVISSFWGYEGLSKYCCVCVSQNLDRKYYKTNTHTKNGNAAYFGPNYSISIAPNYKNSLFISYYLHMSESIL